MSGIGQKAKRVIAGAGDLVLEATRQAVFEHEDDAMIAAANAEHRHCSRCAVAALIDVKVADTKIKDLLVKYFQLDDEEAALALGEGHLLYERWKAKPPRQKKTSNKK